MAPDAAGSGREPAVRCAGRASIVLLSGSSLCHNPRVMKEAAALTSAGYNVRVLGAWLYPEWKARDLRMLKDVPFQFTPVLDLTTGGLAHAVPQFMRRARRKAANIVHGWTGRESPHQLGLVVNRLYGCASSIPADLFIAHSEPALYVAWRLSCHGRRVGVDMEDWFSEDLLPDVRRARPLQLLRTLERTLLSCGAFATCSSQVMSVALAKEYQCVPPKVVYNSFPWSDRMRLDRAVMDRKNRHIPSVHWYSTTLGPGRGIEDLISALPLIKCEFEIHLRGNPMPGYERWIKSQAPEGWRDKIFFHVLVSNDRLLSRVAEHDVGLAGEMKHCRNRDLTVTNKILHYLLGGLAVLASDTSGQREVANQAPGAIELYPPRDRQVLAQLLTALIGSPERLARAKSAALEAAENTFCWERQESVVVDAVARALLDIRRDARCGTRVGT